jgi:hypothetical protein
MVRTGTELRVRMGWKERVWMGLKGRVWMLEEGDPKDALTVFRTPVQSRC